MKIDVNRAFVLYGSISVIYSGRATSVLDAGNYLILHKPDGSISVHGGRSIKPLNYQNGAGTLYLIERGDIYDDLCANQFDGTAPKHILRADNGGESLLIAVHRVDAVDYHDDWCHNKVRLVRSERDLVDMMLANLDRYFPDVDYVAVETEVPTPYGNVDMVMVDAAGVRHLVEAKRNVVSVVGCGQLARYANYYGMVGVEVRQYVAAPAISRNAVAYAGRNGQSYVRITFDD